LTRCTATFHDNPLFHVSRLSLARKSPEKFFPGKKNEKCSIVVTNGMALSSLGASGTLIRLNRPRTAMAFGAAQNDDVTMLTTKKTKINVVSVRRNDEN
jgi:hypothetical protein